MNFRNCSSISDSPLDTTFPYESQEAEDQGIESASLGGIYHLDNIVRDCC